MDGARLTGGPEDADFVISADPEGNEARITAVQSPGFPPLCQCLQVLVVGLKGCRPGWMTVTLGGGPVLRGST